LFGRIIIPANDIPKNIMGSKWYGLNICFEFHYQVLPTAEASGGHNVQDKLPSEVFTITVFV